MNFDKFVGHIILSGFVVGFLGLGSSIFLAGDNFWEWTIGIEFILVGFWVLYSYLKYLMENDN